MTERYVATYSRISNDKRGQEEGVGDQDHLGAECAERLFPGVPVRAFTDPSISAAGDEPKDRPGWQTLLDAVALGEPLAIISAEQSRLERDTERWSAFLKLAEISGVESVYSYRGDRLLWKHGGERVVSQIMAALDEHAARVTRIRTRERLDARAQRGLPHLGQAVFGFRVDAEAHTWRQHPDEAPIVLECIDRVLSGWSLASICTELTKRGAPTRRGGAWRPSNLRKILESPTHAGLFRHKGVEHQGTWEPLVDEATWREVCAVLSQRGPRQRRPNRRHLLSAIVRCEVCDGPMYGISRFVTARGYEEHIYRCVDDHVSINADPVDAAVLATLRENLSNPAMRALWDQSDDGVSARRDELTAKLTRIGQRRRELSRRVADVDDSFDDDDWADAVEQLDASRQLAEQELAELPVDTRLDVDAALAIIDRGKLAEQRQLVTTFVDHIVVERSRGRRGPKLTDRLRLVDRRRALVA
jgi:DNA invertase Pin-like site-specific DNA recombinase